MSDRIVIELLAVDVDTPADDTPVTRKIYLKVKEPEAPVGTWAFTCTGHEQVFDALAEGSTADAVTAAGRLLYDAVTAPQPVRDLLAVALTVQDPERRPLYLDLSNAKDSQALPWEALCTSTGRFLALHPRWPVGRILSGERKADPKGSLEPPLRLAAVLSCLGLTAREEWDALRKAVESSGAAVEVLLLLSEQDLYDEIDGLGDRLGGQHRGRAHRPLPRPRRAARRRRGPVQGVDAPGCRRASDAVHPGRGRRTGRAGGPRTGRTHGLGVDGAARRPPARHPTGDGGALPTRNAEGVPPRGRAGLRWPTRTTSPR